MHMHRCREHCYPKVAKRKYFLWRVGHSHGPAAVSVQREIIACLPEIVEDSEHAFVVKELRSLLETNAQLLV
jgi:hypothetical protein